MKRLVKDEAVFVDKEIELLIESKYKNVVQYYGVKANCYFSYKALELCICNLNDLIHKRA